MGSNEIHAQIGIISGYVRLLSDAKKKTPYTYYIHKEISLNFKLINIYIEFNVGNINIIKCKSHSQ